jgi:methylated-DNA-[protein]-cysteine S-methyltransferase
VAYNKHGISACRVLEDTPDFASWFAERFGRPATRDDNAPRKLVDAIDRLLGGGTPKQLPDYDLRSVGPFARDVLTTATTIAPGEVRPYGWIAERIGRPRAVRAVGTALGGNPIPLLIPCHRVVRNDGKIGHYAFGSAMKQALLAHEGVDLPLMAGAPPRGAAANRRPT